jgi:preprotein translocase SecE subunit
MERIRKFFEETRQEWRHVNWPTGREAAYLTAVVIGLCLLLAVFLGAFDYLFLSMLRALVSRSS